MYMRYSSLAASPSTHSVRVNPKYENIQYSPPFYVLLKALACAYIQHRDMREGRANIQLQRGAWPKGKK